jgi:hypothetical protein
MSIQELAPIFLGSSEDKRSTAKFHEAVLDTGAQRSVIGYAQAK